jgi:hypothetical protein
LAVNMEPQRSFRFRKNSGKRLAGGLMMKTSLNCPRCGSPLKESEPYPGSRWLRFFRCEECCSDWHFVDGFLQMGKVGRMDLVPLSRLDTA